MPAAAMATSPEARRARQQSSFDLDAVDATETVPVPSLIYGGARAWGPAGDTDAELKNAYDSVNLVRSDLIREFESRGVSLARLERDFERAQAQLVEAETAKSLAEVDAQRWRDAVAEMERQRDERARERNEERKRNDLEDETRVRRCATLEAELAAANARLNRAETDVERLKSKNDALVKEKGELKLSAFGEDDADGFARRKSLAASERDVAEARAAAAEAAAEAREARLECRQSALRREELERRLEQTESALRDAEGLVGEAEAAVAQARADAEAARGGAAASEEAAAKDSRIAELETALAALRGAAAQDAAAVAAARRANVDAATVAAAEERASAERARAARAEARLAALEDAAVAAETSRSSVSA
jgi:mitotic spindle assembly checkpoint protein MAD1